MSNGRKQNDFTDGERPFATVQTGGTDSGPIHARPENSRARAIADLSARIAEAAMVGDLALARILGRALAEVLGEPPKGEGAVVVDLNAERKERT